MNPNSTPQTNTANRPIRFLIGVDGGGSGTRAQVCLPDGRVVGRGQSGPSGLGQGIEQAWRHVLSAIAESFAEAGAPGTAFEDCAIGLGLAGTNVADWRDGFLRTAPTFHQLVLDSDAHTSVLGAHAGGPGSIVAAGTGSVGEAFYPDGRRKSVGGWGFPVGDEGSGAWLGLAAMREAQCAADGRAADSELTRRILAATGGTAEAMQHWCVKAGQHAYAQLAPIVFDCADLDPRAGRLLDAAAAELDSMAHALDPNSELPLALLGSLGRRLEARLPAVTRARCVAPAGDACDGALHLIRRVLAGDKA
jgi:glucosamine kinase